LVVHKPSGLTSHDVVDIFRRRYRVRTGHAGTLDPMAQGVLVLFLEKGLKILQYIPPEFLDKTYLMRVTLGSATDTFDATGQVTSTNHDRLHFPEEDLLKVLSDFIGAIDQVPPVFSAVKVNGNRSYNLARAGTPAELPSRRIHVSSMRLLKDYWNHDTRHLVFRLHCSRGTYVRSIAHELGAKLGCGGHLSYLLRERVGIWSHSAGFPLWKVEANQPFHDSPAFTNISGILPFSKLIIQKRAEKKITNGAPLDAGDIAGIMEKSTYLGKETYVQIVSETGDLLALYSPENRAGEARSGRLLPERVLV
jgi:tRNA pseudouridine55 synthase